MRLRFYNGMLHLPLQACTMILKYSCCSIKNVVQLVDPYHECGHILAYKDPTINLRVEGQWDKYHAVIQRGCALVFGLSSIGLGTIMLKNNAAPSDIFNAIVTNGVRWYFVSEAIIACMIMRYAYYHRLEETRCDAFAYEVLLKNNQLEPIMHWIIELIDRYEKYEIKIKKIWPFYLYYSHPSDYERLANVVKALRKSGVDFNNLHGVDPELAKIAAEKVNTYFPELK